VQKRIDGSYQPVDYFWAYDRGIRLSSNIKGVERKSIFEMLVNNGDDLAFDPSLTQHSLTEEQRRLANTHPARMGGEYLPDCEDGEVEIARIAIASTMQDVTCVYVKRVAEGISYRIVDEYQGMTLDDPISNLTRTPMALSELVQFFMTAWNLHSVLDATFVETGHKRVAAKGFVVDASSNFYAQFGEAISKLIDDWISDSKTYRHQRLTWGA